MRNISYHIHMTKRIKFGTLKEEDEVSILGMDDYFPAGKHCKPTITNTTVAKFKDGELARNEPDDEFEDGERPTLRSWLDSSGGETHILLKIVDGNICVVDP